MFNNVILILFFFILFIPHYFSRFNFFKVVLLNKDENS